MSRGYSHSLSPRDIKILKFIESHGVTYASRIKRALKLHPEQLYRCLRKLLAKGFVRKIYEYEELIPGTTPIKVAYYYLTEKGKRVLRLIENEASRRKEVGWN